MTKVTIEALVEAPRAVVWEAMTEPQHIVNWNFASPDWQCPRAENDMRVGGKYAARMEAKDGSFGFDFEAIYSAVDAPNSYAYTMGDGREVETRFVPEGGATRVTTVFDAETQNDVEFQRQGWQAILNNFKAYTERL